MIIWIPLVIGFSLLVSVRSKMLPMVGFSVSLVISSLVSFASHYIGPFLSGIETICFYFTITFFIVFSMYIFLKKEIDDLLNINVVKLSTNLIPRPCWGKNCREIEPYKLNWAEISYFMLSRTTKCKICGVSKSKDLKFECHEEWSYNNNTQKLEEIMAICQKCHLVKHIGRTKKLGNIFFSEAIKHMQSVNGWSNNIALEYIDTTFKEVKKLNKVKVWEWDATWLDNFMCKNEEHF